MRGLACLPMYDFPWTASALDDVWTAMSGRLRAEGLDAPEALTRGPPLNEMWRDPGLILGQTCGYPFWRDLRGRVLLIATPIYRFDGCDGPRHRGFLVARREDERRELGDFQGARAAINARDSNTGTNLFRAAVAPLAGGRPFFSEVVVTGAHARSLAAVANDFADVAAIDAVSFGLLGIGRPDLVERVRVFARTPSSPGLPFIASATLASATVASIRRCLFATLADPGLTAAFATLGLAGAEILDADAYAEVAELEQSAIDLGYPELA